MATRTIHEQDREPQPRLTGEQVWRAVTRASFAVLSHVTPAVKPRSSLSFLANGAAPRSRATGIPRYLQRCGQGGGPPAGRTDLMTARPPSPAAAAAASRAFRRRSLCTLMAGTSSLLPCPAGL
jgi:hypothetical protein